MSPSALYGSLHITNGDIIAQRLASCGIGTILPWRENFIEGRTPPYVVGNDGEINTQAFNNIRAEFLSSATGGTFNDVLETLEQQAQFLNIATFSELTLWFEEDLFDHLLLSQILYLITTTHTETPWRVTLIQTGESLLAYSPEEILSHNVNRKELPAGTLELYVSFWKAFTSDKHSVLAEWLREHADSSDEVVQRFVSQLQTHFVLDNDGWLQLEKLVYTHLQQTLSARNVVLHEVFKQAQNGLPSYASLTDFTFLSIVQRILSALSTEVSSFGQASISLDTQLPQAQLPTPQEFIPNREGHWFGGVGVGM